MSKEFELLLETYWDLAYLEGKSGVSQGDKANAVLHSLRKLAEQPAPVQQEPVAYVWTNSKGWLTYGELPHDYFDSKPLYTSPPAQRKPLTDDEIAELMKQTWGCASIAPRHAPAFARAIEAAHGIKGDA